MDAEALVTAKHFDVGDTVYTIEPEPEVLVSVREVRVRTRCTPIKVPNIVVGPGMFASESQGSMQVRIEYERFLHRTPATLVAAAMTYTRRLAHLVFQIPTTIKINIEVTEQFIR